MTSAAVVASMAKSGVATAASGIVGRSRVQSLDGLARGVRTSAAASARSSPCAHPRATAPQARGPRRPKSKSLAAPLSSGCVTSARMTTRCDGSGTTGGGASRSRGGSCKYPTVGGRITSSGVSAVAALGLVAAATGACDSGENDCCANDSTWVGIVGSSIASCTGAAARHAQSISPPSPSASAAAPRVLSDLSLNVQRCSDVVDDESDAANLHISNNALERSSTTSSSRHERSCEISEQQRKPEEFRVLKELKGMRENRQFGTPKAVVVEVGGPVLCITDVYLFDGDAEVVGRGTRGVVFSAKHRLTGQRVAVKKISRSETTRLEVMEEVAMLKLAGRHPNVVTLQAFFEDEDSYYIVMDLCQGGELYHRLADKGRYSEGQAARIMAEVAEAVGFLHLQGIVHFDLKPENIMLAVGDDYIPEVRIADFGSAFRQHRELLMARDCTIAYSAPEVLAREAVDEKVDMWALGVVMWVLLTGRHPFGANVDIPVEEVARRVAEEEPDLRCRGIRHVSPEGKDLVRRLLAKDPEDRPSAYQMLSHPWLRAVMTRAKASNITHVRRRSQ